MATWREVLADTERAVGDRHHARWICERAANADAATFRSELDDEPTERMVAHLDAMLARYATGEPVQYVIGSWPFRHIDLAVDRRVLIPRPETELVAGVAIELAAAVGPTRAVADLGTGSGAIGLSLAFELPLEGTTVWITDVSGDALDVARANLAGIGRHATNVRVAQGEWFAALDPAARFDVVVSNPPYVEVDSAELADTVREWEPHVALFAGDDGLDDLRRIIADAPGHLRPGGWLVVEIGSTQGAPVVALLAASGLADIEIRPDLAGLDRIAVARLPHAGQGSSAG